MEVILSWMERVGALQMELASFSIFRYSGLKNGILNPRNVRGPFIRMGVWGWAVIRLMPGKIRGGKLISKMLDNHFCARIQARAEK